MNRNQWIEDLQTIEITKPKFSSLKRLIKLIPSKTSFKKETNYQCQNESSITTMKEGMSLQVLQALKE